MIEKQDVLPEELENAILKFIESVSMIYECQKMFDKYDFKLESKFYTEPVKQ